METETPQKAGNNGDNHSMPNTVEEVQHAIIVIVADYSGRQAAYLAVYNWLGEIPGDLASEWLKMKKINSPEVLKKNLAYLQSKHRKLILAERRKSQEEFVTSFEKWLWENDPQTAANRMLNQMTRKSKLKPKSKG